MSFNIVATIYSTHAFPSRESKPCSLCIPAEISEDEAKTFAEMSVGNNFELPPQLLAQIKSVNDAKDGTSQGKFGKLVLEQIASIEIQDASEETLARFYVSDTHRDGVGKANYWRPLSEADEERVTVADWKRNNGTGIFVMSVNEFDREWGDRLVFHDVVLTPNDKIVRLIGDSFCVVDPTVSGQPASRAKLQAATLKHE